MSYKAIQLIKRPSGDLTPDIFATVELPRPVLEEGQFLVRQTHMSLDPAMRTWLQEREDSYIEPVQVGEVMRSYGVGEVVESRNPDYPAGARVIGITGWAEYVLGNADMQVVDPAIDPEALLSVFYMTGLTAYVGLIRIGRPKAGETLVVSGAAGSVGSLVGQIAKAEGMRVVGIAGSDEKCRWLEEELGFDKAINYKSDNLGGQLDEACPNGIDLYYENTGGVIQPLVFERMNRFGRIVVCGMISEYNRDQPTPGPSWVDINLKALRVEGFVVVDHQDKAQEATEALAGYLQNGQLRFRTQVLEGLDSAIDGLSMLFRGDNTGKLLVRI
ncbi:NADP-dependent oxidoreductase [Marinobacterium nitratireducens]|uniref:NADP-dependent oxidoreductase n=1 Tax=Marinobacterium nitratireducens TaxID=518897 RepID=A0A917Z7L2_9GAMM|nr:NADP-dependent oxidoreductase [Marinobacterium nitratireducens]GGO77470.1 NADP-dependent oxidoreductase [Marinobacterium nitratireducens]